VVVFNLEKTHEDLENEIARLNLRKTELQYALGESQARVQKQSASLKWYRAFFENLASGMAYCRMILINEMPQDFQYLETNPAFEKLTGLKDVVGKRISEVLPELKDSNPEVFKIYGRVASCGKPETFETYVLSLKMWVSVSVSSPEKGYFVALFENITMRKRIEEALKASEEKYRLLIENASEGVLVAQDGMIKFCNTKTLEMTGFSLEELMSRPFPDFVYADDRDMVVTNYNNRLEGGLSLPVYEFRIMHKNGSIIWVEIKAALITWGGRNATLNFLTDVTRRKQLEEEISDLFQQELQHRQKLEEEARTKNLFIDVLAHELRTPLTSVLVSSDMLAENPEMGGEFKKRLVTNINNSSKQLAKRLDELLDLARYSKGAFKIQKQPTNFYWFMDEIMGRFDPILKLYQQDLTTEIVSGIPVIKLDQSRIEQVIINLLSNAGKYSHENGTIVLKAKFADNNLLIEVIDHGIGISAEEQKNVFQPYYRVNDDQKIPGIGLGLAVSKLIIEAHGGKIWLTSQPGQGSAFSILIPVD
jgi:PAS domain S-box-containing protein